MKQWIVLYVTKDGDYNMEAAYNEYAAAVKHIEGVLMSYGTSSTYYIAEVHQKAVVSVKMERCDG